MAFPNHIEIFLLNKGKFFNTDHCWGRSGLATLALGILSIRHSLPEFMTTSVLEYFIRKDSSICLSRGEQNRPVPSILKLNIVGASEWYWLLWITMPLVESFCLNSFLCCPPRVNRFCPENAVPGSRNSTWEGWLLIVCGARKAIFVLTCSSSPWIVTRHNLLDGPASFFYNLYSWWSSL